MSRWGWIPAKRLGSRLRDKRHPRKRRPPSRPCRGRVSCDFGVRGTSVDGDSARYERYRDLGDGLFLETVRLNRERKGWLFDLAAEHVGRRDQRYVGNVVRPGKVKGCSCGIRSPCC